LSRHRPHLRIAHVDTGRTWRGGQGQVFLLMRELARRGHTQMLLAPQGPLLERAAAAGLVVTRWESHGEVDLPAMLAARRELQAFAPDLAHLHSGHAHALGAWPARWAGVGATVVSRRVDFKVAQNAFSALKYRMPVDRYFCISRGVEQVMQSSGVPVDRLAFVPSGVDLDDVLAEGAAPAPDLRAWLGIPGSAEVVGTVASLAPHKHHVLLLQAVPQILAARPGTHFVWLGEGECRADLERLRGELGLEAVVHMPGFHPQAKALMRQFTLFALTSHLEGLCTSLLDAQVLGVPIVATAVGGIPEVVADDQTGALIAELEPQAVAARVLTALAEPERRARWVTAARESVKAFGIAHTAERTLIEYARVLEERRPVTKGKR
jgi:glycosyltransferase involved in cell wall biosynthesis